MCITFNDYKSAEWCLPLYILINCLWKELNKSRPHSPQKVLLSRGSQLGPWVYEEFFIFSPKFWRFWFFWGFFDFYYLSHVKFDNIFWDFLWFFDFFCDFLRFFVIFFLFFWGRTKIFWVANPSEELKVCSELFSYVFELTRSEEV